MCRLIFFVILILFVDLSLSLCFGGGGGGGGGCGGGCGCGRKKRSIDDAPPPFTNLAGKGDQMLCNSPELKDILLEVSEYKESTSELQNMRDTSSESGKSIAANLDAVGERYVVVCSEGHFDYFIHPSMEFCGVRNSTHHCQAFAL